MKKILLILLLVISVLTNAQTTIKMERDGGIYKIKCKVNGAPMKMYFDTGASSVSISLATALYLRDNDLIDKTDILGKAKTATADGTIVDNMVIRLKDVEIGGMHLKNVEAVVSSSLNAPLLLGQTAISKLGKITLNGDLLIIHSSRTQSMPRSKRDELDAKIRELFNNIVTDREVNYTILDIIKQIEITEELNEFELISKLKSEINIGNIDEAVIDAENWIDRFSLNTDSIRYKMEVLLMSAQSNLMSKKGNKELGMQHLNRCSSYFLNQSDNSDVYWSYLPILYYEYDKYKNNGFMDAVLAAKSSVKYFLKKENVTIDDINNNKHKSNALSLHFHFLEYNYYQYFDWINNTDNTSWTKNQVETINVCTIMAAKLGHTESLESCNQNNIDCKRLLSKKEIDLIGLDILE